MLPCALIAGRKTDIATNDWALWIFVFAIEAAYRYQLLSDLEAVDLDQHTGELAISRCREYLPSFTEDAEANFRIGQRILLKQMKTVAYLGIAALQKLQTGRDCATQVTYGHGGPFAQRTSSNFKKLSTICSALFSPPTAAVQPTPSDASHCRNTPHDVTRV